MWEYDGRSRPPFAAAPGPNQESVWDYPRPPVVVRTTRKVEVYYRGHMLASSTQALRVLETAGPPTFYLSPSDVNVDYLSVTVATSYCEWKGIARYWQLHMEDASNVAVAWCYPEPNPDYAILAGLVSFYPSRVECFVDDERVQPQPGSFYGGWVTHEIVGPIKGDPGTEAW
jgi:uncharacterized protein (DUF427 family)